MGESHAHVVVDGLGRGGRGREAWTRTPGSPNACGLLPGIVPGMVL